MKILKFLLAAICVLGSPLVYAEEVAPVLGIKLYICYGMVLRECEDHTEIHRCIRVLKANCEANSVNLIHIENTNEEKP